MTPPAAALKCQCLPIHLRLHSQNSIPKLREKALTNSPVDNPYVSPLLGAETQIISVSTVKGVKMSETAESKSFFRKHWEGYKEFWAERFSFMNNYSRFLHPEKPLPRWNSSTVEEFIASDPVHGPTLKIARQAGQFGVVGAAVGAASTAALAWKWSKSPHGAALSLAFGAAVGGTFGIEIANHWYQLYRVDPMAAQVKFYEWLEKRA